MKYVNYLLITIIASFAISCVKTESQKDNTAAEEFLTKTLNYNLKEKQLFILCVTGSSCSDCIKPYYDALLNYIENKNYLIITDTVFYRNIVSRINIKKQLILVDSTNTLKIQRFMRTKLCLITTNNYNIDSVTIISNHNLKNYSKN